MKTTSMMQIGALALTLLTTSVMAAVSPQEAAQLGTTLTPMGAQCRRQYPGLDRRPETRCCARDQRLSRQSVREREASVRNYSCQRRAVQGQAHARADGVVQALSGQLQDSVHTSLSRLQRNWAPRKKCRALTRPRRRTSCITTKTPSPGPRASPVPFRWFTKPSTRSRTRVGLGLQRRPTSRAAGTATGLRWPGLRVRRHAHIRQRRHVQRRTGSL